MSWAELLAPLLLAGAVQGVVTWAAVRVELRWLRRDVDLAHERITRLETRVGRRQNDQAPLYDG